MAATRVFWAGLATAAIAVTAALGSAGATAAPAPAGPVSVGVTTPGTLTPLVAGAPLSRTTYVADRASGKATTAAFTVTYHGFSAPAKAAFQRAVDYWSTQLVSKVPITVDATYTALGTGILGSAGPGNFRRDFTGAPKASTWYVESVANKIAGRQIDTAPDVVANFSSAFKNWYFGTGRAPAGSYDFQSVVTHELGHGLGFLGFGSVSGGKGSVKLQGFPTPYDRVTETAAGKKMLAFPDASAQLASALQSNAVVIDTPAVRAANNNKPAKLYAPTTWRQGSSYSHLDEATFPPGRADSLMTPGLSSGETIRSAGPITKAVFKAVGW